MEQFLQLLFEQLQTIVAVLPALFKALVIFIVGSILARVFRRLIKKAIEYLGLDKLASKLNDVEFIQRTGVEVKPSRILSSLVYYFTLLVFLMASVEALGMQMISDLMKDLINYIPQALTAFVVLLIGIFIADFVKKTVVATCRSLNISAGNLIGNVIFYFIFLNIVLIALRQAELQTSFMENNISIILAGVAGAFAIGYGLASRDVMANLLASFYNRGRISVGDEVSINGQRGEIVQMSNNSLTLKTDDSEVIVPFHKLTKDGVEIHSRRDRLDALPPHER